eukprot:COSAG03_NODE_25152_length_267_cov_0.928571_1_plen_58_part_01
MLALLLQIRSRACAGAGIFHPGARGRMPFPPPAAPSPLSLHSCSARLIMGTHILEDGL